MKEFLVVIITFVSVSCVENDQRAEDSPSKDLIRAADISFVPEIQAAGTTFKNSKNEREDILDILKEAGCNTVRLRVWHTPADERSNLLQVAEFVAELKAKGFKIWITLHYSDTWADPGKQTKPVAWKDLTLNVLADSVYDYTKKVIKRLEPDYLQIGNEINGGLLWPEGSINNIANFATLMKRGVAAVRDERASTKIMIHYAGTEADWFFDVVDQKAIDYDMIALSYYPRWHTKDLKVVQNALIDLSNSHNKDIVIAEVGYPFTLGWNDWTNNLIGEADHLIADYPATETGQKNFLLKVRSMIEQTPRGVGFAYWAPEWVAFKGNQALDGSSWENMALFDFEYKALPALELFKDN
jgi:arabinogalactan endo-1,4-beta-galactosidase